MMMSPQIAEIIELLTEHNPTIDSDSIVFSNDDNIKDSLDRLKIKHTKRYDGTIYVETENFPIKIFSSKKAYLKLSNIKDVNSIVLDDKILSYIDCKTYVGLKEDVDNHFFSNAFAYSDFINFLKKQDNDSENAFHFVDYFNDALRRLVFTSLSDKGRIIINYGSDIPKLDTTINHTESLIFFKSCFDEQSNNLPKFLKNALIEFCSRFPKETRFKMLFENLEDITTKAKINFEIYLNELSIDKIVKDYEEYKSKYFKDLSDILNNLTTKIIGLPLLIVTTLFAIDKVKDSNIFLAFIISAIIASTIYLIILLQINFDDLRYISLTADKDYKTLNENKFFTKYPDQINDFKSIKGRIDSRISYLKKISECYFWILGISNLLIVDLAASYILEEENVIWIFSLLTILILAICRNDIVKKFSKNDTQ